MPDNDDSVFDHDAEVEASDHPLGAYGPGPDLTTLASEPWNDEPATAQVEVIETPAPTDMVGVLGDSRDLDS